MEILEGVWKQHLRPRAALGYGAKIFLPSPPNYVTRSPGWTSGVEKWRVQRGWRLSREVAKKKTNKQKQTNKMKFKLVGGKYIYIIMCLIHRTLAPMFA